MLPLILASASPRRSELLKQIGVEFQVIPSPIEEADLVLKGEPATQVIDSAFAKSKAVAVLYPGRWVLSADTVVCIDNKILGKPKNDEAAKIMLKILQGSVHQVFTGVSLIQVDQDSGQISKFLISEKTKVWMDNLTEEMIAAYVATKEPMDKAGAYAIQAFGGSLIKKIEGCYYNVVGLPLYQTAALLRHVGIALWQTGGGK